MSTYYVKAYIDVEVCEEEKEFHKTHRDAVSEIEHLSLMQPENTYAVCEVDGSDETIKMVVVNNQVFIPM